MSTAIAAAALGKRYRLGEVAVHNTLRDRLADLPKQLLAPRGRNGGQVLWALRGVSFVVPVGQAVGIIGRNGCGKSTLLKVLSRITEPTEGRAEIRGRVGALLEAGTGFHSELSGRENVFVNGAILGMSRNDVRRRFDEIVSFAGVEDFIDTPVKRYSNGMRLRLAFAVAAHLEPEILVVDEVLAVGDAEFQRRCLGRMNTAAKEGRTVLFVSHQMEMIQGLCERVIWLDNGRLRGDGPPQETVQHYIRSTSASIRNNTLDDRPDRFGTGPVRLTHIEIAAADGHVCEQIPVGTPLLIRLHYAHDDPGIDPAQVGVKLWIEDVVGRRVTCLSTNLTGDYFESLPPSGIFECHIDKIMLSPGTYRLTYIISIARAVTSDRLYSAIEFTIVAADFFRSGRPILKDSGVFLTPHSWRLIS